MTLQLNHVSIHSTDLAACERFYTDALGLVVGPRPPFPFPGLWLYNGDPADDSNANAVVHIIGTDRSDAGAPANGPERSLSGSGAVDHVAFTGSDLVETLARLRRHGVPYRERTVPLLGLHQVFVDDPHGVVIEIRFPASEPAVEPA